MSHAPHPTPEEVKQANRQFYDLASAAYEAADGRRGRGLARYLDRRLEALSQNAGRDHLLDAGCGTGFVAGCALDHFATVDGIDIAPEMIERARIMHPDARFTVADGDALPFEPTTFTVVAAVALLHHLPRHEPFFQEAFRVLRPGGMLYTDHDLDRRFRAMFRVPLALYRAVRREEHRYRRACPALDHDLYLATEFHRNGLDPRALRTQLTAAGFMDVQITVHWLGLSPWFDAFGRLLGPNGRAPHGFAPSLHIQARKRT